MIVMHEALSLSHVTSSRHTVAVQSLTDVYLAHYIQVPKAKHYITMIIDTVTGTLCSQLKYTNSKYHISSNNKGSLSQNTDTFNVVGH
jgi:hypothetical protein